MEREACVCDQGFERSDLCAEIIIIITIIMPYISQIIARIVSETLLQTHEVGMSCDKTYRFLFYVGNFFRLH